MSRSILFRFCYSLVLVTFLCLSLLILSCSDDDDDDNNNDTTFVETAFLTATDYSTGSFATVTLDSPRTVSTPNSSSTISSDAVCFFYQPYIYVVNRFGFDNIQIFNPENNYNLVAEYSVGTGTNPQKITVVNDDKAYVSRLAASDLLIINPLTGEGRGSIDMSAYADDDGFPEMAMMYYHSASQTLFVALQRLDISTFMNVPPSYVVAIDTTSDTISNVIQLEGINPASDFFYRESNNMLYISDVNTFTVNDGGIEMIDVSSKTSQGYCITEEALGGDVIDFVIFSDTIGYAIISDVNFITHVVVFNPTTGSRGETLISSAGYDLAGVEINNREEIWILDRTVDAPALHIYNAATQTLDETIALTTLPPFWISFIENV